MNLTSSSHLTWGRFLNRFRSIPTSLWPPPYKSSAPCACSEPWADQVRHSLATAAETPEQCQVRLQSQQVHQNASRAAETPEKRQSRLHEDGPPQSCQSS
ncbi:hypothetical protein TNCV_55391 [Trichonephila clavipes]|nr:hypothetical protein TNCV_55391 [Trichonephila clavipes]